MAKARNMIIDGYKKGTQLQLDQYGIFYIFNGKNPLNKSDIESYVILSEETSKDVVSTVSRGVIGSTLFGLGGVSASLTGKENKIYTIQVNWDKHIWKDGRNSSILELDQTFYKMFMLKCARTKQDQELIDNARMPSKYLYNYDKWLEHNGVKDVVPECLPYWDALGENPETNPILDCCRMINPEWEAYNKQSIHPENHSDIKSKLQQLKSMYEEELITESEYNAKKQELLKQM